MTIADNQEPHFDEPEELVEDPLEALKLQAKQLGLTYHPSIGVDALRAKIANFLSDDPQDDDDTATVVSTIPSATDLAKDAGPEFTVAAHQETKGEKQQRLRRESLKLVRVIVTCMNPAKREWEGEIFSIGNNVIGTHKKFVPFNIDVGYHVPNIIFQHMKERECLIFYEGRDAQGNRARMHKKIKEFAIEVLPDLTTEELKSLAQRQAMANGTASA